MPNHRSAAPELSVSIVLHNSSPELLRRGLASLDRAAAAALQAGLLGRVALTLIDNASEPDYRDALQRDLGARAPGAAVAVDYQALPANRGFGAGHNVAMAGTPGEFHLVLNPDAELAEDALVQGVSRLRSDADVVLVSPLARRPDGRREFLCKRYPSVLVLLLRGFAPAGLRERFDRRLALYEMRDVCGGDRTADVEIASGCCMLVRTDALRAAGCFDEDFFLYFEDFDLSLRLGRQGRLLFDPAVQIVHHGGYAAAKGLRHIVLFLRSGVRFFNRHGWRWR